MYFGKKLFKLLDIQEKLVPAEIYSDAMKPAQIRRITAQ